MTLARFVRKNAFRNKRRSILTILSIAFSLLLLSFLMSVWRAFYMDQGSSESAQRLITRHKVSLANFLPGYYRQKIAAIPGVVHVVPMNWFQGIYKDQKPENFFARFGTDPDEFFDVYKELSIPPDQLEAWKKDRAGAVADVTLARKYGWKVGDRIVIQGDIYPIRLELTLRGIFHSSEPNDALYFNWKYVEEGVAFAKDKAGMFVTLVDSPKDVNHVADAIDQTFANAPEPTKTETEKAFALGFIAMLGNVKAFILVISLAAVFTILLVSGNTIAMSIRERTREVAVLKTLGFRRQTILGLFIGEAVAIAVIGGVVGTVVAFPMLWGMAHAPQMGGLFLVAVREWKYVAPVAWGVAGVAGFLSSAIPAYAASRTGIVEGLRHIG
ncbi:MAG TPA: FtsX-like permease family protein [Terriglobales bacterium]|nr:FtsX-like permease family protein [Terriglobales bacterium]